MKRQYSVRHSDGDLDESPGKKSSSSKTPWWDNQLEKRDRDTEPDRSAQARVKSEVEVQRLVNHDQF